MPYREWIRTERPTRPKFHLRKSSLENPKTARKTKTGTLEESEASGNYSHSKH